jgi:hypothetical protein
MQAEIAQLVEHATENCGVPSSILGLGTLGHQAGPMCGRGSVVERLLAKEKVVGSNPIARSELRIADCGLSISNPQFIIKLVTASWPSGKARVCKTLITGSNPVDASEKTGLLARLLVFSQQSTALVPQPR